MTLLPLQFSIEHHKVSTHLVTGIGYSDHNLVSVRPHLQQTGVTMCSFLHSDMVGMSCLSWRMPADSHNLEGRKLIGAIKQSLGGSYEGLYPRWTELNANLTHHQDEKQQPKGIHTPPLSPGTFVRCGFMNPRTFK